VVRFKVFFLAAHFADFGTKFVKNLLERASFNRRGRSRRGRGRPLLRKRVNRRRRTERGWGAGRGLGDCRAPHIQAQFVEVAHQSRKELIRGQRSGSGRRGGGGRCGRFLLVGGDERFGSDDEFVVLLQFEFGFGLRRCSRRRRSLGSRRKSRRGCLVERHGDWLIFGFGSAFGRRRCKLRGKLFQRGRGSWRFEFDRNFKFRGLFGRSRRGRFLTSGLAWRGSRLLKHGGPFVGEINFLFGGGGGNGLRLGSRKRNVESFFLSGWSSGLLCGGLRSHEFFVGNARSALETAAKFAEALGTGRFA